MNATLNKHLNDLWHTHAAHIQRVCERERGSGGRRQRADTTWHSYVTNNKFGRFAALWLNVVVLSLNRIAQSQIWFMCGTHTHTRSVCHRRPANLRGVAKNSRASLSCISDFWWSFRLPKSDKNRQTVRASSCQTVTQGGLPSVCASVHVYVCVCVSVVCGKAKRQSSVAKTMQTWKLPKRCSMQPAFKYANQTRARRERRENGRERQVVVCVCG